MLAEEVTLKTLIKKIIAINKGVDKLKNRLTISQYDSTRLHASITLFLHMPIHKDRQIYR